MIHPDTELMYIDSIIGHGLVATKLIPKGTITWARDSLDMVFTPEVYRKINGCRQDFLYKYCFIDLNGDHVLCWDHGRFVNHSCQASCVASGMDFEIAVRDIHPGEQLTDDYGVFNLTESFECSCGAPECRKTIRPTDPENCHKIWDARVREVFHRIDKLPQPLWEFVTDKEEVLSAIKDPAKIPSSFAHYRSQQK